MAPEIKQNKLTNLKVTHLMQHLPVLFLSFSVQNQI